MRASAKISGRIGRWLTWPGWGYAAPRPFRPWAYVGPLYYSPYRPRVGQLGAADPPVAATGFPRRGK